MKHIKKLLGVIFDQLGLFFHFSIFNNSNLSEMYFFFFLISNQARLVAGSNAYLPRERRKSHGDFGLETVIYPVKC